MKRRRRSFSKKRSFKKRGSKRGGKRIFTYRMSRGGIKL